MREGRVCAAEETVDQATGRRGACAQRARHSGGDSRAGQGGERGVCTTGTVCVCTAEGVLDQGKMAGQGGAAAVVLCPISTAAVVL